MKTGGLKTTANSDNSFKVQKGACLRSKQALTLLGPDVKEEVNSINDLVYVQTGLVSASEQALTLLGPQNL